MQEYLTELAQGMGNVLIYFVAAAGTALACRKLINIYDELFRKILHFILLGSLAVWTFSFETWWLEAATVIAFVIIVYPVLMFFERFKTYSSLTTERSKGELKNSLIVVFLMFAVVIAVTEGIFDDRWLALASVLAWGVGDALAALIGKKFGKHKLCGRFLTGEKSLEGTLAMFSASFLSVFSVLVIRGGMNVLICLAVAAVTAAVSAAIELYTKNGMDTITCPLASMAVIIGLLACSGGL